MHMTRRIALAAAGVWLLGLLVAGQGFAQTPSPQTVQPAPAQVTLPPAVPLERAFEENARRILDGYRPTGGGRATIVIDPLINGKTGVQSKETLWMNERLRVLIEAHYADRFEVKPFTREALAAKPLVFIGTFTPVDAAARAKDPQDAYRLWFTALDLQTRTVVAKAVARVAAAGVTDTPSPAYAEAPVWLRDAATEAYVRTCTSETKVGDPINPDYVERLDAAAVVSQAVAAFDAGRYAEALDLFKAALVLPGGDQLRVRSGLYLANVRLDRKADAEAAFADLIDFGIRNQSFSVNLTFLPGSRNFSPSLGAEVYPLWLRTIGDRTAPTGSCLELVGHASRTGTEPYNRRLSLMRAERVKRLMLDQTRSMNAARIKTRGVGFAENIIGTGRDDESDVIDRRVEFKMVKCR